MAKRNYNVKGTKDFLVLALILFFLCLWAIKDAWFTSGKPLERHPQEVVITAPRAGKLVEFRVEAGSKVMSPKKETNTPGSVVAKLSDIELLEKRRSVGEEYKKVKNDPALRELADKLRKQLQAISQEIDASLVRVPEMGTEKSGKVTKLLVSRYDVVEAGQELMLITPDSHFYIFNKSLAIFSFIGFWVFLVLHIFAH